MNEAITSQLATQLYREMHTRGAIDEDVRGRMKACLLGMAAIIETIVSAIFLGISYLFKNLGESFQQWHQNMDARTTSAKTACVDLFNLAGGQTTHSLLCRLRDATVSDPKAIGKPDKLFVKGYLDL